MVTLFIRGCRFWVWTPLCSMKVKEMGQIDEKSNYWTYLPHFSFFWTLGHPLFSLSVQLASLDMDEAAYKKHWVDREKSLFPGIANSMGEGARKRHTSRNLPALGKTTNHISKYFKYESQANKLLLKYVESSNLEKKKKLYNYLGRPGTYFWVWESLALFQETWWLSEREIWASISSGLLPAQWQASCTSGHSSLFSHALSTLLHVYSSQVFFGRGQSMGAHSILLRERPEEEASAGLHMSSGILESWEPEVWPSQQF